MAKEKICPECKKKLQKRKGDTNLQFMSRTYCSLECKRKHWRGDFRFGKEGL